jgi:putative transposase
MEVPYRTMANPVVSLWEHQRALARLHERGIAQINEEVLFRMIGQMRDIASTASKTTKTTKRMRRDAERRRTTPAVATRPTQGPGAGVPPDSPDDEPPDAPSPAITVAGFDQIEQW